ncbi:hypothetical protein AAZX31_03G037600 [Glycine max]|uniref:Tubby C-terminal domain-containing protein n=2 Tax=Glycine subgen. Soja TaxID=1462606 RepID=A0A0R0KF36_SOYBN|nr:protein LURP-one-related 15 [Glycine max]XP_028224348.1 protein LURP-one-related 15-like [Glycine soja]KAG5071083.1 hypothetical protein JHK86_006294 [Glycine max]KAH1068542.1 hypothetical protein GYH30_006208 [Glycine max]KHN33240.1 Protein LURP-one-related 15 [Glycine soja]KRH65505.1 hypothetical protein GLYMA_03G041000v4 [Glycine max]RZC19038.1 Protein LURP-one-related 15 isoform A [Glycine soja]|eukprot:XP_003522135.1 protein LURP-one-related 15 [Glycine max]
MQTRQPFGPTQMTPTTTQVIGSQYCKPSPTSLEIVRTANTFANEFRVYDHNSVFTLQSASFSVHKRCILLHQGNPIVTLRRKRMTAHNRWQVFRGKSDQIRDLLFSVKRPNKGYNIFQPNTALELEVFLAQNTEEKVCEFKIEGNWSNGSCEVCSVQHRNIIALMNKHAVQATGSDNFVVRVEANVDTAFIVALIAILCLE